MSVDLTSLTSDELLRTAPHAADFFAAQGLAPDRLDNTLPVDRAIRALDVDTQEDLGIDPDTLLDDLAAFLTAMEAMHAEACVTSITLIGGTTKSGEPEDVTLEFVPGVVTCLVGPTGSGKSRLLADIEWMAQGDTPTGRRVLIDGHVPDPELRFSTEHKLVAQLSQNMNFVMDLCAREFLELHAASRNVDPREVDAIVTRIIDAANELAGEPFRPDTPVTSLSGGQSRALMIADVAYLSRSPIVLIDEIENAGVDRRKCLDLLLAQDKICLMATHDPILALLADRRLVLKNGGIAAVIQADDAERAALPALEAFDARLLALRDTLRTGGRIAPNDV